MRDDQQRFQVSSFCSTGGCLGVAQAGGDVEVTDVSSAGPVLRFTREEWAAFVAGVKAGEFDVD